VPPHATPGWSSEPFSRWEIRSQLEKRLVAGHLLGPVVGEHLEEVLAYSGAQVAMLALEKQRVSWWSYPDSSRGSVDPLLHPIWISPAAGGLIAW